MRTQIVATIGPSCWTPNTLCEMARAGMEVARLNFSHGTHESHGRVVSALRYAMRETGRPVAVLADLQGTKLRVGDLGSGRPLIEGETVRLTTDAEEAYGEIPVPGAMLDVQPDDTILLDDGKIELTVLSSEHPTVLCRIEVGGLLTSYKGLNLPASTGRPAGSSDDTDLLTTKDRRDLRFAVSAGVDWIALSYVRTAADIERVRTYVNALIAFESRPRLMAKIETPQAVEHIDSIIDAADGVMVARGDLGLEMPAETVPLVQKMIIRRCNRAGTPVVTATQMLESMCHQLRPTRAEVSDVANAILDGSDAVMLSGETASGRFPVEAVRMMRRIIERVEAEHQTPVFTPMDELRHVWRTSHSRLGEWPWQGPARLAPLGR